MPRAVTMIVCLFLSLQSFSPASAQFETAKAKKENSSLASRLAQVKHVGLSADERAGGFTLRVYTPEQQKNRLKELEAYPLRAKEYETKVAAFDEQLREARQRGASSEDLTAIATARDSLQRPFNIYAPGGSSLYDVVGVGTDYIEIQSVRNPEMTSLIPMNKICRVLIEKTASNPDATDKADNEQTKR